jgi:hypothetical protein
MIEASSLRVTECTCAAGCEEDFYDYPVASAWNVPDDILCCLDDLVVYTDVCCLSAVSSYFAAKTRGYLAYAGGNGYLVRQKLPGSRLGTP